MTDAPRRLLTALKGGDQVLELQPVGVGKACIVKITLTAALCVNLKNIAGRNRRDNRFRGVLNIESGVDGERFKSHNVWNWFSIFLVFLVP